MKILYFGLLLLLAAQLQAGEGETAKVYRTYTNTIFRKSFPEYIIQKDNAYRTYSNSINRKPFPVGQIDEEAP